MLLAPSDIHFVRELSLDAGSMAELLGDDRHLHERLPPKVQVAEKDGAWFALNNGCLHIIRDLERRGKCAEIRVEVVPLSRVPHSLQGGMVVDSKTSRHRVPPTCAHLANLEDDTSSYTSSEYSDEEEEEEEEEDGSDSEYDEEPVSCNVCDRSFGSGLLLSRHQQSRRHFGCSVCDACFPNLGTLERHKESLDHWSEEDEDDDGNTYESDSERDEDDDQPRKSEEMERLL